MCMFRNSHTLLVPWPSWWPLTILSLLLHPCLTGEVSGDGTAHLLQIIRSHVQTSKLSDSEVWNLLGQVRHVVEQAAADPSARHTRATPKLLRVIASNNLDSPRSLIEWASAITSHLKERSRSRRASTSLESISSLLRHGIAATLVRTVLTRGGSTFEADPGNGQLKDRTVALMMMLAEV